MRHSCLRAIPFAFMLILGLSGLGCDLQHSGPSAPQLSLPAAPATPAPPVQVYGCGLPRGTGDGFSCGGGDAVFADAIRNAIDTTRFRHPEWFEGDHVLEVGRYVDETVENLRRMGLCAFNDGEEVAVKNSNDFSEQWDIISGGGNIIMRFTVTCRPAWSAIPPAGDNS